MAMVSPGGFTWPWESMHYEVLAWYDHWLKGRDTGILDGPPIRYQIPGSDGWRISGSWPPPEAVLTSFALRADGQLGAEEGESGSRSYLYLPADSGRPSNANPPELPASLTWDTPPLPADLLFAGNIELALEAEITAADTGWIAVLYDVPPSGDPAPITAGWLRASFSEVDAATSVLGAPVVPCRTTIAIPRGARVTYRIPVVPNARRLPAGHRLRLVIASADEDGKWPTVLGFTHVAVREASRNTVFSTSRLWLPVLPA
jgi:putative CocE/NonD family hydrolase